MHFLDYVVLEHTNHCKYLGVLLPLDWKCLNNITDRISSTRKKIGMMRRTLYWAKLIAYKSLGPPHLQNASCVWDPFTNMQTEALELVQDEGVRIIFGLRWRKGVMEGKKTL